MESSTAHTVVMRRYRNIYTAMKTANSSSKPYIGRFAPSPSGDLHFGSLVTALGSYLQAKSQHGQWRLRIDDIDPPREVPGAADSILATLECYGLYWDGPVVYQSQRHAAYREILAELIHNNQCYYCRCTRHCIHEMGGLYNGRCRWLNLPATNAALRISQCHPIYDFNDRIRGTVHTEPAIAEEDFIIHRKDGLFAYNLVVVIDDHYQGVTEIVRGADLIAPTSHQISLYRHLSLPEPTYAHLPLALNKDNNKLSKQNHAQPIPTSDPRPVLIEALNFLQQPYIDGWQEISIEQLLALAIKNWDLSLVPDYDSVTTKFQ